MHLGGVKQVHKEVIGDDGSVGERDLIFNWDQVICWKVRMIDSVLVDPNGRLPVEERVFNVR